MIPVFKPLIQQHEIDAAVRSLEDGWLGMGRSVGEFEDALKFFIEADDRHVVCVSTGHAALHLAMMLIGAGPGDEIITPAFNNIADFQAIHAVGAEPVFCDIRDDTLCIDTKKAEDLITDKTKAIIAMDYDCCLADYDEIRNLADRYGLRVIHDAAHSLGSYYKGKKVGSYSDICMFSFDPVKTVTCIDGGALIVKTEAEVQQLHEMRLIGMGQPASVMYENRRAWTYDVKQLGFRYHMANLHAAVGIEQLKKMNEITMSRQQACRLYNLELSGIKNVRVPESDFSEVTPFLYYIRVPEEHRDNLREYLRLNNVDTGIHWQPGHHFTLFSKARRGDLVVTERISKEILSLPLHSCMESSMVLNIATLIRKYFC